MPNHGLRCEASVIVRNGAAAVLRKMCAASEHMNNLWAECEFFGHAHAADPRTVFLAHYMYDLSQAAGSWGASQAPAACTVGCIGPHFVRYLDWGAPAGLGAFTEVQERECWSCPYQAVEWIITVRSFGWLESLFI